MGFCSRRENIFLAGADFLRFLKLPIFNSGNVRSLAIAISDRSGFFFGCYGGCEVDEQNDMMEVGKMSDEAFIYE